MQNDNRREKAAMEALYLQRIDGLGKCLLLWSNLCSKLGAADPWHYTDQTVYHLRFLIGDMVLIASQIDEDLLPFWQQMEEVLSRVK